jgi:hypothetical protein
MRSGLVVFKQPSRLQGIKDTLHLRRLHAQLERYLVDRREDAIICRRQTPEIDQRLELRCFEPLHLRVINETIVDAKPAGHAGHDATPYSALAPTAVDGGSRNVKGGALRSIHEGERRLMLHLQRARPRAVTAAGCRSRGNVRTFACFGRSLRQLRG